MTNHFQLIAVLGGIVLCACSNARDEMSGAAGQNAGVAGAVTVSGAGGATPGTAGASGLGGNAGANAGGGTSTNGGMSANGGTSASTNGGMSAGGGGAGSNSGGDSGTGGSVQQSNGGAGGIAGSVAGVGGGSTGATHWVGTWSASPYPVASGNAPPSSLANSVVRQVVHVSLGGAQIRVQFSNLSGNGAVTIKSAHVAICKASPAVDSTIDPTTDTPLLFAGTESVTIAQGKEVWSDPADFTVAPLGNVSITTAFGTVPSDLTGHAGSRTTSYQAAGSSTVNAASMASARTVDAWYYISGMDVMADASAKAAVAIGDSITDGRGTDTNKNNRWTDILSARLRANAATVDVAMLNQGIGATNLVGTTGTAAQARFSRDVLGQSGVKYAIVYDGVNDIGGGASFAAMKSAYDSLISAAHGKGLLIYGATIMPFDGNSYYSVAHESVRQQVNTYIKSGAFDGVIDFDAALTDGGNPPKLQATYAAWAQTDGLHPGPAGYQKMGDTPDLALFTK